MPRILRRESPQPEPPKQERDDALFFLAEQNLAILNELKAIARQHGNRTVKATVERDKEGRITTINMNVIA